MEIRKVEALMEGMEGKSKENTSGIYGDMEGEFVMGQTDLS